MFARFFVDRPVFATVISVVIILVGLVCLTMLPVAQYPDIAPPTVSITAVYPGASAAIVAETVAAPIEQEVNGVENMIYMSSRCTNDGQMALDVTFALGTNLDMAQVLVQNRVSIALAKLPEEVRQQGVITKKKSPSILLCVNLISQKETDASGKTRFLYDQLYLSNQAIISIKDELARIKGVGDVAFLGPREYSMRVWLDPDKLAARNLVAGEVIQSIRKQNRQVAAGRIGQPPVPRGINKQLTLNTLGRLRTKEQFGDIVVKADLDGSLTFLRDVVRDDRPSLPGIELGAKNYDVSSDLDGDPAITLALFQQPGSNALTTARQIRDKMEELKRKFPRGVDYKIVYDTTVFVDESVHEVYKTLFEAFILVFVVVLLFLQDWRATLLPMIDVPVSLVGTFAVMALLGFSLNNLSLFGLVLAIGIVVDDAIVVVENIERWMAKGLPPREATIRAMDEITGPVIAITLVLSSVFIPTAFIAGISGQFFKQFALTIAASTIISAINAMTMAPARAVTLIKPHTHGAHREALPPLGVALLGGLLAYFLLTPLVAAALGVVLPGGHGGEPGATGSSSQWAIWGLRLGLFAAGCLVGRILHSPVDRGLLAFFKIFNAVFDGLSRGYGRIVRGLLRVSVIMVLLYGGLLWLTAAGFRAVPQGFIPQQDKGYLVVNASLPEGASLERTEAVIARMTAIAHADPAIRHTIGVPGYSILTGSNIANSGGMFVILKPFEERAGHPELSANAAQARLQQAFFKELQEAQVGVFSAPPVDGVGSTGGLKMQVQDRAGLGLAALQGSVSNILDQARGQQTLAAAFTTFSSGQPQLFVDVDRTKAQKQGIDLTTVYDTLQAYLGSAYVNDITLFNRNWQVVVQADARYRLQPEDIGRLKVRNNRGEMVPLGTLISVRDMTGPALVNRYNQYPAADVISLPNPGVSSGQAVSILDRLVEQELPSGMGFEWTELTYQQIEAGKDLLTKLIFPLSVLFVLLVLAANYESWSLPIAIILIVPMCLLAAIIGVWWTRLENNIFTQIGLVVLVGLAAKNAILIVEFAKQQEDSGMERISAIVDACQQRLRPILMTSFAFILGVVPLLTSQGAGSEMRKALGVPVFSGMVGVTLFGLVFTPVFYSIVRRFSGTSAKSEAASLELTASKPSPAE